MMVGVSTFMLVNAVIAGWRENANSSSRIFFSQAIKKHHRFSYRAFESFLPIYFIRNVPYLRSWLPFYRPCSFASQPFDCFAENIQFTLRSRFHFLDIILSHRAEPVNCLEQLSQKICFFEAFFRYACTSAAFLRSWSRSAASGWASALSKFSISISRLGAWLGCCSIFSYCWRTVMGILPWHI